MNELCVTCGKEARLVYKGLCVDCYRITSLPCENCDGTMVAETHRQNDGRCFDCFFPEMTNAEEIDRTEHLARVRPLLADAPSEYLEFLQTHDGHQRYSHRSTPGVAWRLASCVPSHRSHLFESVNIDGNAGAFHEILRLYALGLAEIAKKGRPQLHRSLQDFGIGCLASGFAIGEDNADILFLDPTDGLSVWCFHHEGEVERLKDNFQSWFKQAKPYFKPIKKTAKSLRAQVANYVGHWGPTSQISDHLDSPDYVFYDDSRARCIFPETRSELFGIWRLFGKDKLGFQTSDVEWKFTRLADGSIHSDDFGVPYELKPSEGT